MHRPAALGRHQLLYLSGRPENYLYQQLQWLKVRGRMLADGAYKICRKFIPLVDISAYLTYKALLFFCLWLRFYMLLIVIVSHGLFSGDHSCLGDAADEHGMGSKILHGFHIQGHESVDELGQIGNTVTGTKQWPCFKFIYIPARLLISLIIPPRMAFLSAELLFASVVHSPSSS